MKVRESGMPEEEMWDKFFDYGNINKVMGINKRVRDIAEFGCGYGGFTIPAAKVIRGKVYALDIELEMVRETQKKAKEQKLNNIETKLIWQKNELFEITQACNGCGECRSKLKDINMCPVFRATGREAASTRAKANLLRGYLTGAINLKDKKYLAQVADYCINCKACANDCPNGVKGGDLMLEIKASLAINGFRAPGVFALTHFGSMLAFASYFSKLFNFFSSNTVTKLKLDLFFGISKKIAIPKISNKPAIKTHRNKHATNQEKLIYFVDTYSNYFNPNISSSLINILRHNGFETILPKQKESGIVGLCYGNLKVSKNIAAYNINNLYPYAKRGMKIICTEPTAALMLRAEYLRLFDNEKSKTVSLATTDIMSFLYELMQNGKLKTNFSPSKTTYYYHKPCHQKFMLHAQASANILKLIPDTTVIPINEGCCGMAGTYGTRKKNLKIRQSIGSGLFEFLKVSGINCLTECSTCKLQIENNTRAKVRHPIEIISSCYS